MMTEHMKMLVTDRLLFKFADRLSRKIRQSQTDSNTEIFCYLTKLLKTHFLVISSSNYYLIYMSTRYFFQKELEKLVGYFLSFKQ